MPQVIETTVYTFAELSDDAKERARDWFRGLGGPDDFEHVIEDAQTAAALLGIEFDTRRGSKEPAVYWSGFYSQGDGACFEGRYRWRKGCVAAVAAEFPTDKKLQRIAADLYEAQRRQFYKLEATTQHRGHYYHSGCMTVDVMHADDSYRDLGEAEEDVRQAMRDFADWIYSALDAHNDWYTSDEITDENITANEYTFTAEGESV